MALAAAACSSDSSEDTDVDSTPTTWTFRDLYPGSGITWYFVPVNLQGALDMYDHGAGIAAGDIDGDGHDDLVLLSQCGKVGYFLGRGDGTFRDVSARLSMLNDGIRSGISYGDYDLDGREDLYVAFARRPNALLHQNADGSFTDVGAETGTALNGHYTGSTFVDINGDGWLDLVVAGTKRFTIGDPLPASETCPVHFGGRPVLDNYGPVGSDPSALFINQGPEKGFVFVNEAEARGIPQGGDGDFNLGFGDVVAWDPDRDGDIDLVFSEMFGRAKALENDGTGHFTDVTARLFPQVSYGPPGASVGDFNGDGWPDIYFTDMHSDMWLDPGVSYSTVNPDVRYLTADGPRTLGIGDNPTGPLFGNTLFLSDGKGGFVESALTAGAELYQPWGSVVADFDNDGDDDVFVPCGMGVPFDYMPNVMLVNEGGHFARREKELALDPPPQGAFDPTHRVLGQPTVAASQATATADFNEDGAVDLAVVNWGNRLGLYENRLPPGHHWLSVRLKDRNGLPPVGARITATTAEGATTQWVHGARGYLSQSSQWVQLGLGTAEGPVSLTVVWPDGESTEQANVDVDTRFTISR